MNEKIRAIIAKADKGISLGEDELTELYCEAPDLLSKCDGFERMLRTIAEFPIPEQDNMVAANMRQIARRALGL